MYIYIHMRWQIARFQWVCALQRCLNLFHDFTMVCFTCATILASYCATLHKWMAHAGTYSLVSCRPTGVQHFLHCFIIFAYVFWKIVQHISSFYMRCSSVFPPISKLYHVFSCIFSSCFQHVLKLSHGFSSVLAKQAQLYDECSKVCHIIDIHPPNIHLDGSMATSGT